VLDADLLGAWLAARQLTSMLHGVRPVDPATLATVAALTLTVGLLACAIPAWRAARTNPLDGLRE
jgi:putative ABC transport system permease protein